MLGFRPARSTVSPLEIDPARPALVLLDLQNYNVHPGAYDAAMAPTRDRPQLPPGYITRAPKGMLTWVSVERMLRAARYLWVASTSADGSPHLVEQWCAWVDDTLYFEGSDRTLWARNLERDPRLAFGVQVGDQAAYGQAVVDVARGLERSVAAKIARQYATKYGTDFDYRPSIEQYEQGPIFRARPTKLIAFDVRRFNTSATRFTFGLPPPKQEP